MPPACHWLVKGRSGEPAIRRFEAGASVQAGIDQPPSDGEAVVSFTFPEVRRASCKDTHSSYCLYECVNGVVIQNGGEIRQTFCLKQYWALRHGGICFVTNVIPTILPCLSMFASFSDILCLTIFEGRLCIVKGHKPE